uniref:Uncharacterized protein n=1 Tax=Vibrio genomosp. F6 TaxID=723172 RepID=A0A0H3ZRT0_9VIBR|nr:hypothetical protein [Vibrio genomosp. F6]
MIKSRLSALILPLILVGFCTNSVAMRMLGKVDGEVTYPLAVLVACSILSLYLIYDINKLLKR